jgi:hypothetical protein
MAGVCVLHTSQVQVRLPSLRTTPSFCRCVLEQDDGWLGEDFSIYSAGT